MIKILFAASEAVPFIKTGGLADVTGSLPGYFDRARYDVRVIFQNICAWRKDGGDSCVFYVIFM